MESLESNEAFKFNPLAIDPTGVLPDQERLYGHYDKVLEANLNDAREAKRENRKFAMEFGRRAVNLPASEEVDPVKIDAHREDKSTHYHNPPVDVAAILSGISGAINPRRSQGIGWKSMLLAMAGTAAGTALLTAFPWSAIGLAVVGMLNNTSRNSSTVVERVEKVQMKFYDESGNEIHVDRLPEGLKK